MTGFTPFHKVILHFLRTRSTEPNLMALFFGLEPKNVEQKSHCKPLLVVAKTCRQSWLSWYKSWIFPASTVYRTIHVVY